MVCSDLDARTQLHHPVGRDVEKIGDATGASHATHNHDLRIYLKQLRDKLETDPAQPRHFITETGIGYRLVAEEAD